MLRAQRRTRVQADLAFVWAWLWGIPTNIWGIHVVLGGSLPHAWRVTWTKHRAMWAFYWSLRQLDNV